MKYIVASDIHGSLEYTNKLIGIINEKKPDKVILLGDLYYHGPRNPLPLNYNPKEVSKVFNNMKDRLIVIKGNCDAVVDEMISDFKFNDYLELMIGNKKCFFTHGHQYNKDNIPNNVDVLIYGHFHTGFIENVDGVICINSGSITLPKNNTKHSYLEIDNNVIKLLSLDNELIDLIEL